MKSTLENTQIPASGLAKMVRPMLYGAVAILALLVAIMWGAIVGVVFDGLKQNQKLKVSEPEYSDVYHEPWDVSFVGKEYDIVNNRSIFSYYVFAKDKLAVDNFSVSVPGDSELDPKFSNAGASIGIDVRALFYGVKFSQSHQVGEGKLYRFGIKGRYDIGVVEVTVSAGTNMMKLKRPGPVPWSLKEYYTDLSEQMDQEQRSWGNAQRLWRIEPFAR